VYFCRWNARGTPTIPAACFERPVKCSQRVVPEPHLGPDIVPAYATKAHKLLLLPTMTCLDAHAPHPISQAARACTSRSTAAVVHFLHGILVVRQVFNHSSVKREPMLAHRAWAMTSVLGSMTGLTAPDFLAVSMARCASPDMPLHGCRCAHSCDSRPASSAALASSSLASASSGKPAQHASLLHRNHSATIFRY
jgi:hypothetical protein